jgi:hypothetical protein
MNGANLHGLPPATMSTVRLRHKPQTEDEDAAALKLGPGSIPCSIGGH